MTSKGTILVGTVGQGVMMSADDGESWTRAGVRQGMHSDCIVRMLRSEGRSPEVVYAGTDFGLYRSDDGGGSWRMLWRQLGGVMLLQLALRPMGSAVRFTAVRTSRSPGLLLWNDWRTRWACRHCEDR